MFDVADEQLSWSRLQALGMLGHGDIVPKSGFSVLACVSFLLYMMTFPLFLSRCITHMGEGSFAVAPPNVLTDPHASFVEQRRSCLQRPTARCAKMGWRVGSKRGLGQRSLPTAEQKEWQMRCRRVRPQETIKIKYRLPAI